MKKFLFTFILAIAAMFFNTNVNAAPANDAGIVQTTVEDVQRCDEGGTPGGVVIDIVEALVAKGYLGAKPTVSNQSINCDAGAFTATYESNGVTFVVEITYRALQNSGNDYVVFLDSTHF